MLQPNIMAPFLGLQVNRTLVPNSRRHGVMSQNQSKLVYTVTFMTFIPEVLGSNFDRDTTYRVYVLRGFPQSIKIYEMCLKRGHGHFLSHCIEFISHLHATLRCYIVWVNDNVFEWNKLKSNNGPKKHTMYGNFVQ